MRPLTMTVSVLVTLHVAFAQAADVELIFPPVGAGDVATNTSLLLRAHDADARSYGGELRDAVVLHNAAGESLSTGAVSVSDSGDGFFLSTEPLALSPNATYRVFTLIATCSEEGRGAVCPGEERLLGEFVTGASADVTPPEIVSTADAELSFCNGSVTLESRDDRSPPGAIRYLVSPASGDPALLWSTEGRLEFRIGPVTVDEGEVPVEVTPVDASGNRGEAIELPLTACNSENATPWSGESDIPPIGNDVIERESESSGCSLSTSIPGGAGGSSALLVAIGLWLARRQSSSRTCP